MEPYEQHYQLTAELEKDTRIIPAPPLYPEDDGKLYAAILDRLAQPLPTGESSPFSAPTPGNATSILIGTIVHLQGLLGHELNLLPDRVWVLLFRMMGIEINPAEYPVIMLTFQRSEEARRAGLAAEIPLGTAITSSVDLNLVAFTITDLTITGDALEGSVPARLSQLGAAPNLQVNEFRTLPRLLSFVDSVTNDGRIVSSGSDPETLAQAMLRARAQFATGARCVTARDFYVQAMALGATKVNVLPGVQTDLPGKYSDLTTTVVYPGSLTSVIFPTLLDMSMGEGRIRVDPAEIIPIDGTITVRVIPSLLDSDVWNLVATQMSNFINPPNGAWGDTNLEGSIATAMEKSVGIYAVPDLQLKHATTGQPLAQLNPQPWQLFEIQQSLKLNVLR